MLWDLINREKLRRALLYLLYVLLCLLAQDSIFASLPLFGVNMFFLPAAAVAIGMFEDGVWGAAFGLEKECRSRNSASPVCTLKRNS